MATPFETGARLLEMAQFLEGELSEEMNTIAVTGNAMVVDRVSETGKDANGALFPPYTRAYELKKRGATGNVAREGKKKRQERREKPASADRPVGRYKGFVDFTLSGRMLTNIGLVEKTGGGGRIVVRMGGRSEETKLKMEGNNNNRPGWYTLSRKEISTLAEQSSVRLRRLAERFLAQ